MKKSIILMGCIFICTSLSAVRITDGTINGSVNSSDGKPLEFVTVFLSTADSVIVAGTATDDMGQFSLKAQTGHYILAFSMIGYKDRTLELDLTFRGLNLPAICLEEDDTLLEAAGIQAVMPKTKLTGEGLQTNVRGSVLENAGSANDVLKKTPGIISGQNGLEVIGKGSPLVYINGRKVTDSSELDRLQSNEIQSVEVITNPGAQYDATVRSVVRIRTVRRQGDGFSFNLNASDAQSLRWNKGNDPFGAVNLNYRIGGLDIFAGVNYAGNTSRQISDLEKASFGKKSDGSDWVFENKGSLLNEYSGSTLYGNAGANWQMADNHFLGGKVEWGRHLTYNIHTEVNDNVYENGTLIDKLTTNSDDTMGDAPAYNLGGNVYYNALFADKLGVDINLDYYTTDDSSKSVSREESSMTSDASIESNSNNSGHLYAAKAVLSYPVWRGQLQAGSEGTFTRRTDDYAIDGISIPASKASIAEDNIAGFASYALFIPKWGQMSAGVRYEHVTYSYKDVLTPDNDLSRRYSNWFPTLSYANSIGPVQLMFNYSARTRRPSYANMSSVVRYNSRYIWQSGNSKLQPELSHNISATALWRFITFAANYTRTDDAIMGWSSPIGKDGVVLVKPRNIESPYRMMAAFMNMTPTIGIWNVNYTFGVQTQWLTIKVADPRESSGFRETCFNGHPLFFTQLFNTFKVKGGWQFELGGVVQSKGYSQNMRVTNVYCDISVAVQKKLLQDGSLVLRLEGSDLAGTAHYNVDSDFGSHTISQTNLMDTQKVKFSLRYSFNTAQSKYRGTGAGSDSKNRM